MSVPNKQIVVSTVNEKYQCALTNIKRKQIMYEGTSRGKRIVLCTPSSKLHVNGNGWFDLTTKQVDLLDDSHIAILVDKARGRSSCLFFMRRKIIKPLPLFQFHTKRI